MWGGVTHDSFHKWSISKQLVQFSNLPLFSSVLRDFSSTVFQELLVYVSVWHWPALCYCHGDTQAGAEMVRKVKARLVTMWQGNTCNPKLGQRGGKRWCRKSWLTAQSVVGCHTGPSWRRSHKWFTLKRSCQLIKWAKTWFCAVLHRVGVIWNFWYTNNYFFKNMYASKIHNIFKYMCRMNQCFMFCLGGLGSLSS